LSVVQLGRQELMAMDREEKKHQGREKYLNELVEEDK
jgi:hypothetical protein